MNPAIQVRPAVAADIPQILEIDREAEAAAHFSEADYQQALTSQTGAAAALRRLLVVETSGRVQGFLVARFLHEEWEIENVAVAKAARRKGLGWSLVSSFLQSSSRSVGGKEDSETRARAALLEVRESNLAARQLYEKFGFIVAGRRTSYYRHPDEDAILYSYSFQ